MKRDSSRKVFRYFAIRLGAIFIILIAVVVVILTKFPPHRGCTLIGCSDSLTLDFSRSLAYPYTVDLTGNSGEAAHITCSAQGPGEISTSGQVTATCNANSLTVNQFTPRQVSIKLTWPSGSYTTSTRPVYDTYQPNGPDCQPTCYQATSELSLP